MINTINLNRIDCMEELDALRIELKYIRSNGGNKEVEIELIREISAYEKHLKS
jgi:hypothetical protein